MTPVGWKPPTTWDHDAHLALLQAIVDKAPPTQGEWENILEQVRKKGYTYTASAAMYAFFFLFFFFSDFRLSTATLCSEFFFFFFFAARNQKLLSGGFSLSATGTTHSLFPFSTFHLNRLSLNSLPLTLTNKPLFFFLFFCKFAASSIYLSQINLSQLSLVFLFSFPYIQKKKPRWPTPPTLLATLA